MKDDWVQRAPVDWVQQLTKMLAQRKLKLLDALLSLQVGTVQGSPISPLLFVLFINPLIERIKEARKGVPLLEKEVPCMSCECVLQCGYACVTVYQHVCHANVCCSVDMYVCVSVYQHHTSALLFADDVCLVAESIEDFEREYARSVSSVDQRVQDACQAWIKEVKYLGDRSEGRDTSAPGPSKGQDVGLLATTGSRPPWIQRSRS
jgi:hypothetical protein